MPVLPTYDTLEPTAFKRKAQGKYLKAIEALSVLASTDNISRAFATVMRNRRYKELINSGWTPIARYPAARVHDWLHSKRTRYTSFDYGVDQLPPNSDHSSWWTDAEGRRVFITQPYGLYDFELKEMIAYAEKYHLKFEIEDSYAFYFVGRAICVVWRAAEIPADPLTKQERKQLSDWQTLGKDPTRYMAPRHIPEYANLCVKAGIPVPSGVATWLANEVTISLIKPTT